MTVLVDDLIVQRAAGALLEARYVDYLAAAELNAGESAGSVPRPIGAVSFSRQVQTGSSSRRPPYLVAACPGDQDPPTKHGRRYGSTIRLGLCAVVAGGTFEETETRAKIHAAALRDCLLDHPALGGVAIASDWIGRRYDVLDADRSRTLGACEVLFSVDVRAAADLDREPISSTGAPIPWPTVESAQAEVLARSAA